MSQHVTTLGLFHSALLWKCSAASRFFWRCRRFPMWWRGVQKAEKLETWHHSILFRQCRSLFVMSKAVLHERLLALICRIAAILTILQFEQTIWFWSRFLVRVLSLGVLFYLRRTGTCWFPLSCVHMEPLTKGHSGWSEQVELMDCISKDYRWIDVTHMITDKFVSPLLPMTMISVVLMWTIWNMDLRLMCLVHSSFLLNLASLSCGKVVPVGWLFLSIMAKLLKTLLVEEDRVALGRWQGTAKQRKCVQCRLRSMRLNLASH